jgi:hypothetical protein
MRQRCPATATRVRDGTGRGAVAERVGVLAGVIVAADQQMVHTGVAVAFGQEAKPGPGVHPRPIGPGAGGVLLPGIGRANAGSASTRNGPACVGTRRLAAIAST